MINYFSFGEGDEKVIFIHGWMLDHTCFKTMISAMDEKACTYVFVDQRGYGLSRDQDGPFTIVQIAEDVMVLANRLQWDRFHIIGHSMGGKVISRLMADMPERIKSAVGITPCPPVKIPLDEPTWSLFRKAAADVPSRQEIFRMDTGHRLTEAWYESIAEKSIQASTSKAFANYLNSWVDYECFQDIQGCSVPTKILVGENDAVLTAELMQNTFGQWLSHIDISKMSNCGHYPMLEIPLYLAAECENFRKKHSHCD